MGERYSDLAKGLEPYIMRYINNVVGIQRATATRSGVNLNRITLYDESIGDYNVFPITENGLASALASAASGDVIVVPPGTVAGDHTITDGVKVVGLSRYATILTGEITGGSDASIENLSIDRTANDATTLIGIGSPSSGTFYVHNCDVESVQSGSGDAYGISMTTVGSVIEVRSSYLFGSSASGAGYAAYQTDGTILIYGDNSNGSTASYNV